MVVVCASISLIVYVLRTFGHAVGKELPGLTFKPFRNELGQRIYDHISQKAWEMWLEHFKMIMNEQRLAPGDPHTNAILYGQAEAFFFGEGAEAAGG